MKKSLEKSVDLELSLTFDDILIKPNESNVILQNVDLSVKLNEKLNLSIPVFSAAMDTVTGYEMARAMIRAGGFGPLHKNTPQKENVEYIKKLREEFGDSKPICVSVGVSNTMEEIQEFVSVGANCLLVDSAHGHSHKVGDLVKWISDQFPDVYLIAGNIVTQEAAKFLIDRGVNAVKVGMGCGSICTTRKVTGVGRGQVTSLLEVSAYCKERGVLVIADGGIRSNDEIMKSIACGADAVMLGYMLAGCDECPGDMLEIEGQKYKYYRGMGSLAAMKTGSDSRYNQDTSSGKLVAEGIESYVKSKGEVQNVLDEISGSLRSAFGYVGANNMMEAYEKSKLIRITRSVLNKSHVHSIDKLIK